MNPELEALLDEIQLYYYSASQDGDVAPGIRQLNEDVNERVRQPEIFVITSDEEELDDELPTGVNGGDILSETVPETAQPEVIIISDEEGEEEEELLRRENMRAEEEGEFDGFPPIESESEMENSEGGDMDLDNVGQGLAEIVNALNDEISMQIEPFQMPDEIGGNDGDPFVAIRHIEDFIDFFNPLERALARLNQSSSNGEAFEDILEPDIHRNDQQQSSVSFSQHPQTHPRNQMQYAEGSSSTHYRQEHTPDRQDLQHQPHPHNQTQHVEGSSSTHCQQTLVSNTQPHPHNQTQHVEGSSSTHCQQTLVSNTQPYTHNQTQQTEAGGSSTPARQDLQQQSRVHRHIQAEHPPAPTPSTQSTLQQSSDTNRQVGGQVRRPNFNNLEIRRRLNTTRPEDPLDFAAFYTNIGNNLNEAVQDNQID
ncbi:uncharacterized protein LOC144017793 [Festucalex cinctus]